MLRRNKVAPYLDFQNVALCYVHVLCRMTMKVAAYFLWNNLEKHKHDGKDYYEQMLVSFIPKITMLKSLYLYVH